MAAGASLVASTLSSVGAAPDQPGTILVTNVAQLRRDSVMGARALRSLRLEGIVLWDGPLGGKLALQDASGAELIDLDLPERSIPAGSQVRLEGTCVVDATGIHAGSVPVVDNDGLHSRREKSGVIHLVAGRYPIRGLWFNGGGDGSLTVEYAGPGIPRQPIPQSVLGIEANAGSLPGTRAGESGLAYAAYEGHWNRLPDFRDLEPVSRGVAEAFNATVRSRAEGVGLEFSGTLQVAREGLYTFWTTSDDGSRLIVGDTSLRLKALGTNTLPEPLRISSGDPAGREASGAWTEIEGTLSFIHAGSSGGLELAIDTGARRFRVDVQDGFGDMPARSKRVRVQGLVRPSPTGEGGERFTRLVVPSLRFIQALAPSSVAATDPRDNLVVTNLANLFELASDGERLAASVQLDGTILAASLDGRVVTFQSDSGIAFVEMGSAGPTTRSGAVHPGDRVRLSGTCAVDHGRILVGNIPVVDNDGIHSMRERSGVIHLAPGKHPIHLAWANREGPLGLEVYYQGPNIPRQKIPDSVLFHLSRAPVDGAMGQPWKTGLEYRAFEGGWWAIPDFSRIEPVLVGITTNFVTAAATRESNVGVEFSGYLDIARAGRYRFSTVSDDGSLLYVDEEPGRLQITGTGPVPPPARLGIRQVLPKDATDQWAEVEGIVTFCTTNSGRLEMELTASSGTMRVEVADATNVPPRLLLKGRVRATGMARRTWTPDGQSVVGEMLVPSIRQVQLIEPSGLLWSTVGVQPIRAVDSEAGSARPKITRVRGKGRLDPVNRLLRVSDATGELWAETAGQLSEGTTIPMEVLGFATRENGRTILRKAVYRTLTDETDSPDDELPLLTTIEQVKGLGRAEAQRGYPVKVRGVVTALMAVGFFLQDTTGAIYVDVDPSRTRDAPVIGDYWEAEGTTFAQFAPNIYARRASRLGRATLPTPLRPSWDRLINGSLDTQYIEIEGVVTAVDDSGLTLLMRGGSLKVGLEDEDATSLQRCENALVRLRGCLYPERSDDEQLSVGSIYLYTVAVNIDEPAPADLFAIPLKTVGDLLQFDPHASLLQRVKVAGQVLHRRGAEFYLMDGTNGLRFVPKADCPLVVGDHAEVVGFPQLGELSPQLNYAVVKRTGHSRLPPAQALGAEDLLSAGRDATLVSVDSRFVGVRVSQAYYLLELQSGLRTFVARLQTNAGPLPPLSKGSRLRLTGVYAGQRSEGSAGPDPDAMELLLNSPADIETIERAPWWTVRHTLTLVGGLVVILLVAGGWIWTLRSRVEQQTRDLKEEIEDRKRAEREASHAREMADAANRAKSQFLASMSHEIRTPMNGVIGMTNLLLESGLRTDQREFADTAKNSAECLLTLINDILDFSKIEAGKLEFEVLDFDLVELVEATVEVLAEKAHSKLLELNCSIAHEVPRRLRGDPGRLRQVLLNLLGNAVKFTPQGEVTLEVIPSRTWDESVELRFTIRDTGIGLSDSARASLFQPFVQADASTTRKYGGTGLGLGISRRLVEMMHGEISVESQPGQGSTFSFTATFGRGAAAETPLPHPLESLEGRKVLIVDDNSTNRIILQHQIAGWNMHAAGSATDATEALSLLRCNAAQGEPYDLAILDMQMPGTNGLALARLIRSDPRIAGTHLVLLTSMSNGVVPEELHAAGIEAHLTKPVKSAQLQACLLTILGDRSIAPAELPDAPRPALSTAARRLRILVAEDNSVNQKVALRLLQKLGCGADVAANGLEVLESVRRQTYDVVLMDCQMPEMDGYEATRQLRRREGDRKVNRHWIVAMTANAMQGDRDLCLEAGMDDYLSKPVRLVGNPGDAQYRRRAPLDPGPGGHSRGGRLSPGAAASRQRAGSPHGPCLTG